MEIVGKQQNSTHKYLKQKNPNYDLGSHTLIPFQIPEEAKDLVMHTRLTISGSNVMFSDTFPGMPFVVGNNVTLSLVSDNLDEITSSFNRLKEGGKVGMELQETFWSKCYGSLTDKFGIEWQFNYGNGEM